jgi:hypothetical protein
LKTPKRTFSSGWFHQLWLNIICTSKQKRRPIGPLVPVGHTNQKKRPFSSGWWHQPRLKVCGYKRGTSSSWPSPSSHSPSICSPERIHCAVRRRASMPNLQQRAAATHIRRLISCRWCICSRAPRSCACGREAAAATGHPCWRRQRGGEAAAAAVRLACRRWLVWRRS